MRNDMVEEKMSGGHGRTIEGGHVFDPLGEVINENDDIIMSSRGS